MPRPICRLKDKLNSAAVTHTLPVPPGLSRCRDRPTLMVLTGDTQRYIVNYRRIVGDHERTH
jgi:hypothetical protein